MTAGVVVRLLGVYSMSLWLDEAAIANIVSRGRWEAYVQYPASNRPFGYLVVTGWLLKLHNSELSLRILSLIPALLTLPLAAGLGVRLFHHRLFVLLFVFSVSLNAWLVVFAKEFKPYAAEHFVVMLWLFLFLSWCESNRLLYLALLCGALAAAPLFTHAPILAAPSYAIAVCAISLRRRYWGGFALASASLVVALNIALLQFWWVGSNTPPELFVQGSPSYFRWSNGANLLSWSLERGVALFADFVPIGREPANGLLLATCLLGAGAYVVRFVAWREWAVAWLLASPLAATLLFSVMFPWPFGPERVNLYLVVPLSLTVLLGWEFALSRMAMMRPVFAIAFVVLQWPADGHSYTQKFARFGAAQEEIVPALKMVADTESTDPSSSCIIFSRMSAYALRYYSTFHATLAGDVRRLLLSHPHALVRSRGPDALRDAIERAAESCERLWVVLAHYDEEERVAARHALVESGTRAVHEEEFVGVVVFAGQR